MRAREIRERRFESKRNDKKQAEGIRQNKFESKRNGTEREV